MARIDTLANFLTDIANAIRVKGGTSKSINAVDFDTAIANLPSGGAPTLPSEYQQVEYIESTGTQYINTGVIPNQDTGFDLMFVTKNTVGASGFGCMFGTRNTAGAKGFQLNTYKASNSSNYGLLANDTTNINAKLTKDVLLNVNFRNGVYVANDRSEQEFPKMTFTCENTLTIFGLNQGGTLTQFSKTRIYYFNLYDGDTLIRKFIPCYRKSDNVIGLYDTVNKLFYTNSGTDTFLKGFDV